MKEELKLLPDEIRDKELKIMECINKESDLSLAVEFKEIELSKITENERDLVTGKKMYTNETSRKNALSLTKFNNEKYKELMDKLKISKEETKKEEIELRYLRNKLRVLLVLIDNGGIKNEK